MSRVMAALNECETLRARTAAGEMTPASTQWHAAVDPDAVAAVRRQRLTEIASWFNPRIHAAVSQVASDEASIAPSDEMRPNIRPATKWVVEGTGILVATGHLNITLACLIAPRVGRISDFGLEKWLPEPWTHLILIAAIQGTFGYLSPEYVMHGIFDEKTNVFTFGVLRLELITGRLPIESS